MLVPSLIKENEHLPSSSYYLALTNLLIDEAAKEREKNKTGRHIRTRTLIDIHENFLYCILLFRQDKEDYTKSQKQWFMERKIRTDKKIEELCNRHVKKVIRETKGSIFEVIDYPKWGVRTIDGQEHFVLKIRMKNWEERIFTKAVRIPDDDEIISEPSDEKLSIYFETVDYQKWDVRNMDGQEHFVLKMRMKIRTKNGEEKTFTKVVIIPDNDQIIPEPSDEKLSVHEG